MGISPIYPTNIGNDPAVIPMRVGSGYQTVTPDVNVKAMHDAALGGASPAPQLPQATPKPLMPDASPSTPQAVSTPLHSIVAQGRSLGKSDSEIQDVLVNKVGVHPAVAAKTISDVSGGSNPVAPPILPGATPEPQQSDSFTRMLQPGALPQAQTPVASPTPKPLMPAQAQGPPWQITQPLPPGQLGPPAHTFQYPIVNRFSQPGQVPQVQGSTVQPTSPLTPASGTALANPASPPSNDPGYITPATGTVLANDREFSPGAKPPAASMKVPTPTPHHTPGWLRALGDIGRGLLPIAGSLLLTHGNAGAAGSALQGFEQGRELKEQQALQQRQLDQQEKDRQANEAETAKYHQGELDARKYETDAKVADAKAKIEAGNTLDKKIIAVHNALKGVPDGAPALALYDKLDPANTTGLRSQFINSQTGAPVDKNPYWSGSEMTAAQSSNLSRHTGDKAYDEYEKLDRNLALNRDIHVQRRMINEYNQTYGKTKYHPMPGDAGAAKTYYNPNAMQQARMDALAIGDKVRWAELSHIKAETANIPIMQRFRERALGISAQQLALAKDKWAKGAENPDSPYYGITPWKGTNPTDQVNKLTKALNESSITAQKASIEADKASQAFLKGHAAWLAAGNTGHFENTPEGKALADEIDRRNAVTLTVNKQIIAYQNQLKDLSDAAVNRQTPRSKGNADLIGMVGKPVNSDNQPGCADAVCMISEKTGFPVPKTRNAAELEHGLTHYGWHEIPVSKAGRNDIITSSGTGQSGRHVQWGLGGGRVLEADSRGSGYSNTISQGGVPTNDPTAKAYRFALPFPIPKTAQDYARLSGAQKAQYKEYAKAYIHGK